MKTDLMSFAQRGKRTLSFMTQSLGLMADLDLGTEHLRWMGDQRFMYGMLRGRKCRILGVSQIILIPDQFEIQVIKFNSCPIQLSIKIETDDKHAMVETLLPRNNAPHNLPTTGPDVQPELGLTLPPLKYSPDDVDGWVTFEDPILFVYAGKGPYVGRDYMAFPVSETDDGLIDIVVMPVTTRAEVFSAIDGGPSGATFWLSSVRFIP